MFQITNDDKVKQHFEIEAELTVLWLSVSSSSMRIQYRDCNYLSANEKTVVRLPIIISPPMRRQY